jgi:diguanylate cyclase (GGDEF)-like protein
MNFRVPWTRRDRGRAARAARNDLLAAAILAAAFLLLLPTGGPAIGSAVQAVFLFAGGSDHIASAAVLLNIALIFFACRRYLDLRREVIERAALEERARLLASRDQLTNFLTRAAMAEKAAGILGAAAAEGGSVAALVLNLDRFKNVNDVYGHLAGDAILRAVAAILVESAPAEALCARVGGDEYCILLPFPGAAPREAGILAARLVERTGCAFEVGGARIHMTASIGLARAGRSGQDFEDLLRRADIAMHVAKKAGGNRSLWFDDSMESVLKARNEIEAGLRGGIPGGELVPFYQPQVDLATGRLHGFEVLARWERPGGVAVGPDRFIPVAEEAGLIGALFDSVFAQALTDARPWGDITVSVNISPLQLKDPWLAQKILKGLTETGFPAERLEIEITESSLFENLPLAQSIVASLKNQGVRLALDDFGTGYSSLAHLRALPFDRIKIDRSFVQSMGSVRESLAITTAIARMGESLGVPVTAEGVEDGATAARLLEIGCDKGQGWHFGRPLPRCEAEKLAAAEAEGRAVALASIRPPQPRKRARAAA